MKLENQVCSLELAKKLKELGVEQGKSAFDWVVDTNTEKYKLQSFCTQFYGVVHDYFADGHDSPTYPMYSAFTVAELGDMLSDGLHGTWKNTQNKWRCKYTTINRKNKDVCDEVEVADTEANARAKMLVYLLENKIIREIK